MKISFRFSKLRRADSRDFSRGRKRLSTILLRHESKLATKFEASGGSQARKRKARRGKYASGVLDQVR